MNDLMLHRAAQLLEAEFGPQNVEKAVTASGVVTAPPTWLQHFYAIAWTISDITEKIPAPLPS